MNTLAPGGAGGWEFGDDAKGKPDMRVLIG